MRNKLLLTILLTLFFTPLVFAQQKTNITSETPKVEKSEKITESVYNIQKLEEDILNKVNEKFNIREENLKFKENFCDKLLTALGVLIAFFGIVIPVILFIVGVKITNKYEEEFKKIENMRIEHISKLRQLDILRHSQRKKFVELKQLEDEQKKNFTDLETKMKNMLNVAEKSVTEMKEILEAAKGGVDEMKKILKAAEASAEKSAQSQKEAEYSKIISNVHNLKKDKKYEEALLELDKAIKLIPEKTDAFFNKADILRKMKEYEKSLGAYDECIEKFKNEGFNDKNNKISLSFAYNNKSVSLIELAFITEDSKKKQNLYDDAIKSLEKAKSLHKNISTSYNLIEVFLLKKDFENAFDGFKTYMSEFKNPHVLKDDYETRWLVSLDDGIKNGSKAAIEMESLLKESIDKGKLLIKERDEK